MLGIARNGQRMLMAAFALLLACGAASAGENTLTYQGVLRDAAGDAVADGPYNMSFSIHTAEAVGSGALVWGPEAHAGVAVTQGSFSVVLGGTVPLGNLFTQQSEVFLEVAVDTGSGAQPFSPRVALNASPYALGGKAQHIRYDNTASGLAATNAQSAITELDGRIDSLESVSAPVQSVFGRTGAVTAQSGDYNAAKVTNAPAGNLAATNVQAALNELDGEKSAVGHTHPGSAITSQVSSAASADNAAHATAADSATNAAHATIADSATNATHATSADSATDAASAVNADTVDGQHAAAFAATSHSHNLQELGGAVTDPQVPNNITVDYAAAAGNAATAASAGNADTVDGQHAAAFAPVSHTHSASAIDSGILSMDRFSAYNDLLAESKIGAGAAQVAAGDHTHVCDVYYNGTIGGETTSGQYKSFPDDSGHPVIASGITRINANKALQVPVAGRYYIHYQQLTQSYGTGATYIHLYHNSTVRNCAYLIGDHMEDMVLDRILDMAAGDRISFLIENNQGGNWTGRHSNICVYLMK